MSKPPMVQNVRSIEPPPGVTLSYVSSIKGLDGAAQWCAEIGMPVSEAQVKKAKENRDLASTFRGGAVWFASQDLWDWLMSMRREVIRVGVSA